MTESQQIKRQLISHLQGGEAFIKIEELLKFIPFKSIGIRPEKLPYSFYEVFYHICFTQKDILNYCMSENYTLPKWPANYWPAEPSPENEQSWIDLKIQYLTDRNKLSEYIQSPQGDLLAPLANGAKHNLLREIMLLVEHSAYHTGQLLIILRQLGLYDNNQNGK